MSPDARTQILWFIWTLFMCLSNLRLIPKTIGSHHGNAFAQPGTARQHNRSVARRQWNPHGFATIRSNTSLFGWHVRTWCHSILYEGSGHFMKWLNRVGHMYSANAWIYTMCPEILGTLPRNYRPPDILCVHSFWTLLVTGSLDRCCNTHISAYDIQHTHIIGYVMQFKHELKNIFPFILLLL